MTNDLGLHGNAILSKFPIGKTKIIRNDIGDYFSDAKSGTNANGYEKRLGGRMLLLAEIVHGGNNFVVGSIHKLSSSPEMKQEIVDFFRDKDVVIAGDQSHTFCADHNLQLVGTMDEHTWPASCFTYGSHKGDIICSNMHVSYTWTEKPCHYFQQINVSLSDHAIIGAVLELTSTTSVQ